MPLLPDKAYYRNENLKPWIDPETGYDTAKKWSIDERTWPVMLVMSPSQAPQLIMGMKYGIFQDAMKPFGITLELSKLDGRASTTTAIFSRSSSESSMHHVHISICSESVA